MLTRPYTENLQSSFWSIGHIWIVLLLVWNSTSVISTDTERVQLKLSECPKTHSRDG